MKWMKERDLLIAQTMAFVQSVTGKRPDFDTLPATSVAAASGTPVSIAPVPPAAALIPSAAALKPDDAVTPPPAVIAAAIIAAPSSPPPVSPPQLTPVVAIEVPPAPVAAAPAPIGEAPPPAPAQPAKFAKLDIRGDFQSEVRARVANFRANQARFLKEREDYCSSTMDKVRAALRDGTDLPRSSGK
ncbi:hypothetical protein JQ604_14460 [Bradyrhizobium jicamae]|uniref:hypothetical protein n=1 Tax=Bradyrhizobium jicamae TaxID=280332 RepID=UPI001BA84A8E|nr:hypothetical protein [Bradyrhizobium jicamae]MBR0753389.1 hypothetical protein [Bradyrhizobium jicamae]